MMRMVVVFPAPLAPTNPVSAPRGTAKLTSSNTFVPEKERLIWWSSSMGGAVFLACGHCTSSLGRSLSVYVSRWDETIG